MQQYINNFRRYWWFLLLIMVLVPAGQILTVRPTFSYTAGTSLWVEQSLYLEENPYQQLEPKASAATSNAQLLTSLINSPSFLTKITDRVAASGYKMTLQAADELKNSISHGIKIIVRGNVLVQLEYEDRDNHLALAVLNATNDSYNEFVLNLLRTEGQASLVYLEGQVNQLKRQLDDIDEQVNKFISGNTKLNLDDPIGVIPFLKAEDFTYSILLLNQADIKRQYNSLQDQLGQFRINFSALVSGKVNLVTILDTPGIVESFTYDNTFRILLAAGVGLLGGLLLAILAVLLITWWNYSIQDVYKAKAYLGINYVAAIPLETNQPFPKHQAMPRRDT